MLRYRPTPGTDPAVFSYTEFQPRVNAIFQIRSFVVVDIMPDTDPVLYVPSNPQLHQLPYAQGQVLIDDQIDAIRHAPGFVSIRSPQLSDDRPCAALHPTYNSDFQAYHAGTRLWFRSLYQLPLLIAYVMAVRHRATWNNDHNLRMAMEASANLSFGNCYLYSCHARLQPSDVLEDPVYLDQHGKYSIPASGRSQRLCTHRCNGPKILGS